MHTHLYWSLLAGLNWRFSLYSFCCCSVHFCSAFPWIRRQCSTPLICCWLRWLLNSRWSFFSCLSPLFGVEKHNGVLKRYLKDIPSFLQVVFVLPCPRSYPEISKQKTNKPDKEMSCLYDRWTLPVLTKRLQLNQIQLKWLSEHKEVHEVVWLIHLCSSVLTEFPWACFAQWSQVREGTMYLPAFRLNMPWKRTSKYTLAHKLYEPHSGSGSGWTVALLAAYLRTWSLAQLTFAPLCTMWRNISQAWFNNIILLVTADTLCPVFFAT